VDAALVGALHDTINVVDNVALALSEFEAGCGERPSGQSNSSTHGFRCVVRGKTVPHLDRRVVGTRVQTTDAGMADLVVAWIGACRAG
jgi:hypothetical protein